MSTELIKLKATADILGGDVFFATDEGRDPEHIDNVDLLPNGMYIRLNGSDGSIAYVSAFELDNVLSTLNNMILSKADATDIDTLLYEVDNKASKTDLNLLISDIQNKASKTEVDNLLDTIDTKVSQSVVDEIIESLNNKANQEFVQSLVTRIDNKANANDVDALSISVANKADKATVVQLLADVRTLQETVQSLTSTDGIDAINRQIAYLNNEIVKRLTIDDLSTINRNITNLQSDNEDIISRLDNVEVNINKKASTTYVQGKINELNNSISSISSQISNKANKVDLASKASKSDLDNVVAKSNSNAIDIENIRLDIDDKYDDLASRIDKKATKSDIDESIKTINDSLVNKVDKMTFNDEIESLDSNIQNLRESHSNRISNIQGSIDELECEVNNALSGMQASINTQSKTIATHTTDIVTLKTTSNEHTNQLKQTWVRVLSTSEYKRLAVPPAGVPYNPRYKYPNTLYLVVDFGKPKAVYIGDILIAKANQNGSIGFAYTFPITF